MSIIQHCKDILTFFNAIPFGVIADNKLYTGNQLTDKIFWQKWRMLNTLQVINYNGGICWDISNAVKTFLDELQIENYEIYCQMNNESQSSHTFNLIYENDESYYILDGAWKRFNNLTKVDSIYQCCNIMSDRMFMQHPTANQISFYHLCTHKPYFGCNCQQYMRIAKENPKLFIFSLRK